MKSIVKLSCSLVLSSVSFVRRTMLPTVSIGLIAGLMSTVSGQVLITGFEEGEGFRLGSSPTSGTEWSGNDNPSRMAISSDFSHDGLWSLRGVSDSSAARTDSPALHEEGFLGLSYWFTNPTAEYSQQRSTARIFFNIASSTGEDQGRVQFSVLYGGNESGHSASGSMRLQYGVTDGVSSWTVIEAGLIDLKEWNQMSVMLNTTNESVAVWINGSVVNASIPLVPGSLTEDSRISEIQFWTPAMGTVYYDSVTGIIPEPGYSVVIAGSMALLLLLLQTKRQRFDRK